MVDHAYKQKLRQGQSMLARGQTPHLGLAMCRREHLDKRLRAARLDERFLVGRGVAQVEECLSHADLRAGARSRNR